MRQTGVLCEPLVVVRAVPRGVVRAVLGCRGCCGSSRGIVSHSRRRVLGWFMFWSWFGVKWCDVLVVAVHFAPNEVVSFDPLFAAQPPLMYLPPASVGGWYA